MDWTGSLRSQILEDDPMIRNALCLTGLVALLTTAAWQPAGAASFDCAKAEAADEKAICADRQLNDEDVEMAGTWRTSKLPGSSGVPPVEPTGPVWARPIMIGSSS
jgi:hypothetical protein